MLYTHGHRPTNPPAQFLNTSACLAGAPVGGLSREAMPGRVGMDPVGNRRGNDRRVGRIQVHDCT